MKYSLLNVIEEKGGLVDGIWIQDHRSTLGAAIEEAQATEAANSNRITVAVVERLNGSSPDYCLKKQLKRLG